MYTSYDESIGQLINQTNRKIMHYLNSKLEVYNITLEQWNVLLKLSQQDKINQKQLAQKVDKDQPTLARILDILERKKLVERHSSKEDKRAFNLHLTDKGLSITKEVAPYLESFFEIMISGTSSGEIDTYKHVLMKINSNIDIQKKGGKQNK